MSIDQGCVVGQATGSAISSVMQLASDAVMTPGAVVCLTSIKAARTAGNEPAWQRSVAVPSTSIGLGATSVTVPERGERHAYSSKVDVTISLKAPLSQSRLYGGFVSSYRHKQCIKKRRLERRATCPLGYDERDSVYA